MSKTPYEIRYDLLALARDHLLQKYYAEIETANKIPEAPIPTFPTEDEIFKLAEQYKNFVDSK